MSKEEKQAGSPSFDVSQDETAYGTTTKSIPRWQAFKDSFKRHEIEAVDPTLSDVEKAQALIANSPLQRSLKGRHLQMIAIGGAIGTGLFVGSGKALRTGGPAGIIIAWLITGSMLFSMVNALGELVVAFPIAGSFLTYYIRFLDSSWGFAVCWNYSIQWLAVLPTELVAAAITIKYWDKDTNSAAWIAIFYVVVVGINLFGVRGYGEAEFFFSIIKVITVIGFIILGVVLVCGGGPQGGYIGGMYWHHPGAFAHSFKGVCAVFVTAAFSFNGTELVGLAAAESENPRKVLPRATKQVFWRILLFYVISLILIGCLIPYNDKRLISASSSDASASPFVIAIVNGGIKGLPSVMNAVIMIAVLSVGNAAVFASSRTLAAMATMGLAPKFLSYIDRQGRPLFGIMVTLFVGLVSFVVASDKQAQVFSWLMALAGLSSVFVWGSIGVVHIRFRSALKKAGRGVDELPFKSMTGVWGSYYVILINILVLVAQFWIALFPVGGKPSAENFFESYISFVIILVFYIAHKIWTKNWRWYIPLDEIDIDTGRREADMDQLKQEIAEEIAETKSKPFFVRWYRFWC